ncbi:MAG: hypothetical protein IJ151_09720 [Bacteroidales bacterium]|nr:hypothetical protein [Bacteroidales bacterium]MBQ9186128.1 hypothetical protein [Bacteroidales bacterium]
MKKVLLIICGLCCMLAFSCNKEDSVKNDDKNVTDPTVGNERKPLSLNTKQQNLVIQGNDLAGKFTAAVQASEERDFMVSPLGLQFALGMVMNGATDDAYAKACEALGYKDITCTELNEYLQLLALSLPAMDKLTRIEIANAAIVNDKYTLKEEYSKNLARYYDAYIKNKSFANLPDVQSDINAWCREHTHGMIPSIGLNLNDKTVAILLDALYFNGSWACKFDKNNTSKETFTRADGSKTEVDMMKNETKYSVFGSDKYTGIHLPYGNGSYYMTLVLPDEGYSVSDIFKDWHILHYSSRAYDVDLWVPKFTVHYTIKLNDILREIGLGSLLGGNFSRISDALSGAGLEYQQDTALEMSEDGAEASAVTIVNMMYTANVDDLYKDGNKIILHFDKPFLYCISEASTGAVLFAGVYGARP